MHFVKYNIFASNNQASFWKLARIFEKFLDYFNQFNYFKTSNF